MNPNTASGIRTVLKFAGGFLVARGAVDEAGLADMLNILEILFGSLFTFGGMAWSIYGKLAKSREARQIAAKVEVSGVRITKEVAAEFDKKLAKQEKAS